MKLRWNISPNTWMLINSSSIVTLLTVICIFSCVILQIEIPVIPLLITDAGVFLLSFFIYRFILEKFIYTRIRLIYKTIRTLKAPRGTKSSVDLSRDIISEVNTEVEQWVHERTEELEELKKLEAYRREFLGNVSHELKTPLFNIQGYILTLIDGALNDPTVSKEYLLRTEKNIERMISVVEDLEIISRLESGELVLDITNVDIVTLAKEVIDLLETKAKKKGIQLYFRENYHLPIMVLVDKERIRQVLINLIDNSIKYGNENGKTKVSIFDMDENILVEVSDDGIGMDAKHIPRLFERFYRVDKSRSREQGGSGLGLAIVKHILEAHEQSINVRSTPGVGTTFAFTLRKSDTRKSLSAITD
jgi:two-component system, OmpR family, phosphate regulon sensor histidine kinase PhoR